MFASNPEMLDFVMEQLLRGVFFGGNVDQRYKQLARLKLSLLHGCRTCNKQNVPGALEAGITQAQIDAMDDFEIGPVHEAEKAVIAYADEVALTNIDGSMTPGSPRGCARIFREADILELGVAMAVISRHGQAFVRARPRREGTVLPVRRHAAAVAARRHYRPGARIA